MLRGLAIIVLIMAVAGFGICSLCSGAFALSDRNLRGLLVLSALTGAAAALSFWGLRAVWRKGRPAAASAPTAADS